MFQVGEINFCDKIAFNIKTDTKKKEILDILKNKYDIKIINTHSIKFKEEDYTKYLNQINKQQQLIYIRSNGNPYYLYLTKLNDINTCIFIDKKVKQNYYYPRMVITHFKLNDSAFNDNIFDGEMIKDNNNNWAFIVNNFIIKDGCKINNLNSIEKINLIDNFLKENYTNNSLINICNIYIKKFFCYTELNNVINNYIPTLNYNIRGLYVRALNSGKIDGQNYKNKSFQYVDISIDFNKDLIIKNEKEIINHKIDMTKVDEECKIYNLKKTYLPDVYNIYTLDGQFIDIACVPTMKLSKYLYNLFEYKTMEDNVMMAFRLSENFEKFLPMID